MQQKILVFILFIKFCVYAGSVKKSNKNLEHDSKFSSENKYIPVKYDPNFMEIQESDYELPYALNLRNDSMYDIINKTSENKTVAIVNNSIDDIIKKTLGNTTFPTPKNMINDSIDDVINKTLDNKTLMTVPPIIPICELGDGNCTHCKEISMFCHYMYSEKRCVYYKSRHVSRLYECSEKWAEADENWELTVAAIALLTVTFLASGFIIWLRWHITTPEYIEEEDIRQRIETRLAVGRIREKYNSSRLILDED